MSGERSVVRKKGHKDRKFRRHFRSGRTGKILTLAASTKYVRSGGPRRMAEKKARKHGCNKPALHLGKHGERDQH